MTMPLTAESKRSDEQVKVLVAGPPYRGYSRTIARATERCGVSVDVMEWNLLSKNIVQDTLFYTSERYRRKLAQMQAVRNTKDLEEKIMKTNPTFVLVLMAAVLSEKTKSFCHENGIRLAMWAYDSMKAYPVIAKAAPAYDLVYTYEPTEVDSLSDSAKTSFLPMAYDDEVYRPNDSAHKAYDICFVGSVREVPARKATIRTLATGLPGAKIGVWTDSVHWYSPRRIRDWRLGLGHPNLEVKAGTMTHEEISRVYPSSRVCLNIHMTQSIGAPNPRTFEILGSGGALLTDRDISTLEGFESGKGFLHYSDVTTMITGAKRLVEDEELRNSIAKAGHETAVSKHTYVHRVRRILDDLGRL